MDQMSLYFQATVTRVWAPRGQTPTLRISPQRDHRHFYGALNVLTGHEIARTFAEQSSVTTVQFLNDLLTCYPNRPLLLLWDRAPWHKGAVVRDFLQAHPLIQTLHFPPACPQLNPQEHVWERTRDAISHNHTHTTFSALVNAFNVHLETTTFSFKWIERFAPPSLCGV